MKLQIKNYNFNVNIENAINLICIENKAEYRKIVNSLINELDVKDGNILISEDIELLLPSKQIFTFYDYFAFDVNKYALNKFYKKLKEIAALDYSLETAELQSKIEEYIYNLTKQYDLYLDIACDIDVTEIFKALNVKIKHNFESLVDNIINYMNILNDIFGLKIFAFVGLRAYLNDRELIDFYDYVIYNDFKVVLFESMCCKKVHDNENFYCIDEDLCEIY